MTMQLIMSGLGAGGGLLASLLGKKKPSSLEPMLPQGEIDKRNQLHQMGLEGLQDPTKGFQPIADEARRSFGQETMPGIAERYAGLGATRSSGFNSALTGAGEGLESKLAALKAQYGLQRSGQMQNLLGMGKMGTQDYMYQPERMGKLQSFGSQMFGGSMPGVISALGQFGQFGGGR